MSAVIHLQALGLTEYESKAYTALLALGRAAPARIARQAQIPRPKIYETLERLEARGLATRVQQSPLEYAPLSAREYMDRARRSFSERLDALDRSLARLTPDPAPEAVYPLHGEAAIVSLAENLVENARRTLHLAGDDLGQLEHLEQATPRGVQVVRATVENLPPIAAAGQRPFLVARDGEAAIVAHFGGEREPHGVHTHNPVIVKLVEGYVALAAQRA
ncbi:sugar-specific transcriptional regulator TrmB [Deinobacterium chartae]|uniref:Sugar-specific transcriptional regulator TrmB n=1 Tax=Deinobacterium chartae TaxID=521158 RepID=A0A841HYF8_9DEIO|nr:TrmB family transcriptional regulator [Deinobacterium chartae]MBB6097250.1 sugar-specific transcriptional regulator TrmB [Deinobacterium chartae]